MTSRLRSSPELSLNSPKENRYRLLVPTAKTAEHRQSRLHLVEVPVLNRVVPSAPCGSSRLGDLELNGRLDRISVPG